MKTESKYLRFIFNKLVRDNVPDILMQDKGKITQKELSDNDLLTVCKTKLLEESKEVAEANSDTILEEISDVLEVIHTILKCKHSSIEEVEKIRIQKKSKRGGFEKGIYIEHVDLPEASTSSEYLVKNKYPHFLLTPNN